jgi:GDP-4-dehydro-6-deoxy-D-mannose reductase
MAAHAGAAGRALSVGETLGLRGGRGVTARALLVGGTGFVGQHLARRLAGRYEVTVTGREQDVGDRTGILELVTRVRPEIVVNLAAITTVRETVEDPRKTYQTGFFGTLNLLEALESHGFAGRYLQVSSSEIYGHPAAHELPLGESAPLRPMSPYAVAKLAGEMLCHAWAQSAGFAILVARPFTHIGPGQSDRFAVARFAREIAEIMAGRREPVLSVGSLATSRDLTDVRDVVRAYDLILHHGKPATVYNVCSDREVVMGDVLRELVRLSGIQIRIVEDAALVRTAEQLRLCGSYQRLHDATGWRPERPLAKTLSDILAAAAPKALTS